MAQEDQKIQHGQVPVETRVVQRGTYEERQNNADTLNNVAQAFNTLNRLQEQASNQNNNR